MIERWLDRVRLDEWRGNLDGRPTFWSRTLVELFGVRVSLHRMVAADDPACFHTHPAFAIRLILSGGYVEELESGEAVTWVPGAFGIVKPELAHRVASLCNGRSSYSLWIRGPKIAPTKLRGAGWPEGLAS